MKILKGITYLIIIAFALVSCNEGIDPITEVAPGNDELAPLVEITSPSDGEKLIVAEGADVPIFLETSDDIELGSVSIVVDGSELKKISAFTDYRRYSPIKGEMLDIAAGEHTLQVEVKDKTGKTTTKTIVFSVIKMNEFESVYGETFYMSFENHFLEHASVKGAKVEGSPGFEPNGKIGAAYKGATDSDISFPVKNVFEGNEITIAFWYKIAQQGRSGIMSASPTGSNNNRVAGFRLFREGGDAAQTIKLNVGNGEADSWFDGGAAATVNPLTAGWIYLTITISKTAATVYIDGEVASTGALAKPMSLENCQDLYIASGGPYFSEWDHKFDLSEYDELRIFNKVLTQAEIKAIIDAEK